MELKEDWRVSFPGVTVAARFREKAAEYVERLATEPEAVGAEIGSQRWGHEFDLAGIPQPELDEVRSLFERAGEAIEEGAMDDAVGLLEDVIAYCTPEE